MLTRLIHNGVVVPESPPPLGLTLVIRGRPVTLTPQQEEMALAWARKHDTPYVQDPVFVQNFMADFSLALGLDEPLRADEVDWTPAVRAIEAERAARQGLTPAERKAQAAARKAQRQALRETYGYAIVARGGPDERVELANYVVEPGGIFMGRGQHPLRGRWKPGARQSDITLNLSPDAPRPPGQWAEIVWQPESLWVARWPDQLSGKLKYVWLSDTAPIKQEREAQKFDQARELQAHLDTVRARIETDLVDPDPRRRMLATVCYLIDALCLRVGDEKDEDEADTVGATTLRPEHVTLYPDGTAGFAFLGKDSVEWHKTLVLPPAVRQNLEELIRHARPPGPNNERANGHPSRYKPQIFPDISSRDVNAYLSDLLPGLTAKVFRTHHATMVVRDTLEGSGVTADAPEYRKWEAASRANLAAAVLCNHTRKAPASWPQSQRRFQERLERAEERVRVCQARWEASREALATLRAAAPSPRRDARYEQRIARAERQLARAEEQWAQARLARDQIAAQAAIAAEKRTWNLGTSLKSYIDPRVYHQWGQRVGYDVLERYYPQMLRRRFAWVRDES